MVSPVTITKIFNGDTAAANYVNAAALDTQLANLASTVNAEILERQRTVRDGSGLAAQVVTYASLHPQVSALLVAGGVIPKQAVSTIGLSNSGITGLLTIDGYTLLANDRVLLTAQTNTLENGIWVAAAGAWTRPTDAANGVVLAIYTQVGIINGASYPGALFILSAAATVGTTAQTWFLFSVSGNTSTYVTIASSQAITGAKTFSAPSVMGTIGASFNGNVVAGVQSGLAAIAGQVGETVESKVSTSVPAAGSGVYLALTSITLGPGDWVISASASDDVSGTATPTGGGYIEALIGTVAGSITGATRGYDWVRQAHGTGEAPGLFCFSIPSKRVNILASTTYYLNVLNTYGAGQPKWYGSITATRMR